MKRIAPGYYKDDEGYEIVKWVRPERDGYGPAGEVNWVWISPIETIVGTRPESSDPMTTKREAMMALDAYKRSLTVIQGREIQGNKIKWNEWD